MKTLAFAASLILSGQLGFTGILQSHAPDVKDLENKFVTLAIPLCEKWLALDLPRPQIQFVDLGPAFQGYFDGEKNPNLIQVNPRTPSGNWLSDRKIAANLLHEYQHLVLFQFQPFASWELQELMSLLWQKVLLGDSNTTDVQSLNLDAHRSWDQWPPEDRVSYGRLSILGWALYKKCGGDNWVRELYRNRFKNILTLRDLAASCNQM